MTAITPSLLARLATLVFFLPALSCGAEEKEVIEPKDKITLFDGKTLDGWKIFGDQAGWTAKDGVLATTGKPTGYIRTEKHYRNYRLSVEWRWSGEPTNSGVLLHMQAPDKTLPKAVEAQLKHQNAGDLVLLSQSTIVVNGQQVGPGDYPPLRNHLRWWQGHPGGQRTADERRHRGESVERRHLPAKRGQPDRVPQHRPRAAGQVAVRQPLGGWARGFRVPPPAFAVRRVRGPTGLRSRGR